MGSISILCRLMLPALALLAPWAEASTDPAALCTDAAALAAERVGVPYDVLLAVSIVETGRNRRPWPWTVNLGGEGHWLDAAEEAEALVAKALETGATNIDLGCFQLNYRWHAAAFASLHDMLDPTQNALYAAEFLAQHHAETGDWGLAAAAYHSATPEHADRYRAGFETVLAALRGSEPAKPESVGTDRTNRFPLLLAGASGRNGSLVPPSAGGARLIGGP